MDVYMKKKSASILIVFLLLMFLFFTGNPVYADKPPWSGGPGSKNDPPAAPEPFALILIGMGASGAAGYIIGKRKKKKD
jgi:LPXTG-motif cell wall-anchored protein